MKKEYKDKFKKGRKRRVPYTATMECKVLDALDEIDGDRSANIEKAVKAYYLIG